QQNKKNDAASKLAAQSGQRQTALSQTLADYGSKQYALTSPALAKGMDYYSKIAGGDRNAVQGAIAPDVAANRQAYEGTQKYLEQQGVRGGAKDMATAEANRQQAGQIGMMPFGARK